MSIFCWLLCHAVDRDMYSRIALHAFKLCLSPSDARHVPVPVVFRWRTRGLFFLLQADRDVYLRMALHAYRLCLASSNAHDIPVVFRLVSLWFQLAHDPTVNKAMLDTVQGVPSWKFLPLLYQIASRMGLPESGAEDEVAGGGVPDAPTFQSVLMVLVLKMANEHPHHTLPQVRLSYTRIPIQGMTGCS